MTPLASINSSIEFPTTTVRLDTLLAEGPNSKIYSARDSHTRYIVKSCADTETFDKEQASFHILGQSPHILRLYSSSSATGHLLFESPPGGTLRDLLVKGPLPNEQALNLFRQILLSVNYIHSRNIVHRDIRPETIYLLGNSQVKLGDFASSVTQSTLNALYGAELAENIAKYTITRYRAPELLVLALRFPVGTAGDMWALGCVLYEMLFRAHPFPQGNEQQQVKGEYQMPHVEVAQH